MSPKAGKDKGPENEISRGNPENTGTGEIKSEISETDELCLEMKNMQKILKRGRSVLLNPDIDDLKETYKEFKNSSKIIKKKWKELLQPAEENRVGQREEMGVENIRDEVDKKKKRKKKQHTLNEGEIMPDTQNEGTQKDRKKYDE